MRAHHILPACTRWSDAVLGSGSTAETVKRTRFMVGSRAHSGTPPARFSQEKPDALTRENIASHETEVRTLSGNLEHVANASTSVRGRADPLSVCGSLFSTLGVLVRSRFLFLGDHAEVMLGRV